MIAFVDTEVGYSSQQAKDFGAVREDGAVMHTSSLTEFQDFVYECEDFLNRGGLVLIFPETKLNKNNEKLEYKSSAALMALPLMKFPPACRI